MTRVVRKFRYKTAAQENKTRGYKEDGGRSVMTGEGKNSRMGK
jgi:hypothetical protein